MDFMSEFITTGILISAYDVHYRLISQNRITFPGLILLDSGGYEARIEHDLSETYMRPYTPESWPYRYYRRVLRDWRVKVPTIVVSYDTPYRFLSLKEQFTKASEIKGDYPHLLLDFLIKPEEKGAHVPMEKVIQHVEHLRGYDIVGFTDVELDDSVFGRMTKIARLRRAMDSVGVKAPIHIFGSLDALNTALYFIAGAEVFDGLTWLRFGYHDGCTLSAQNYGVLREADGIRRNLDDQYYDMWKNNYYYLEDLRTQMVNYVAKNDISQFQHNGRTLRNAYRQLEASADPAR
jgi:hypothetical protein